MVFYRGTAEKTLNHKLINNNAVRQIEKNVYVNKIESELLQITEDVNNIFVLGNGNVNRKINF